MDSATAIARYPVHRRNIETNPQIPQSGAVPASTGTAQTQPEAAPRPNPLDVLAGRTRRALQGSLRPGEPVRAVIEGHSKQALIVLNDRLVIVKPGFFASAGLGAKITTFPYRQIQGVHLRTAWMSQGLEILSSAYPQSIELLPGGTAIRNALYGRPNCLPLLVAEQHVESVVSEINAVAGR